MGWRARAWGPAAWGEGWGEGWGGAAWWSPGREEPRERGPAPAPPPGQDGGSWTRSPDKQSEHGKRARSAPPTPAAPLRQDRWWLGVDSQTRERYAQEMRRWLQEIDVTFTSYFEVMEANYDTVDQICRLYTVNDKKSNREKYLDPLFFDDNKVTDPEHRKLFEKWFAQKWGIPSEETDGARTGRGAAGRGAEGPGRRAAAAQQQEAPPARAPQPAEAAGAPPRPEAAAGDWAPWRGGGWSGASGAAGAAGASGASGSWAEGGWWARAAEPPAPGAPAAPGAQAWRGGGWSDSDWRGAAAWS